LTYASAPALAAMTLAAAYLVAKLVQRLSHRPHLSAPCASTSPQSSLKWAERKQKTSLKLHLLAQL